MNRAWRRVHLGITDTEELAHALLHTCLGFVKGSIRTEVIGVNGVEWLRGLGLGE